MALALATASGLAAQSTSTYESTTPATEKTEKIEGKQMQSGLQVSGTVVSSDENRLIVKADNGQQMTFIVNESTADPHLFNVGDRVTASYVTLAGTGPVVTKVISAPLEAKTSTGTVTYEQKPAAAATATVTTPAPAATATATVTTPSTTTTTIDNDTVADVDVDTDDDDADVLPATASPLPLIALAGFVAGGAARVIRRFRT
jgi:hypothetical protein